MLPGAETPTWQALEERLMRRIGETGTLQLAVKQPGSDIVDTRSLKVVGHIPTGPRPRAVVFTKDGTTAFVTDENAATVTVVDAIKHAPAGSIKIEAVAKTVLGPRPMGAALSPDGRQLYVSNGRGESIAIIDVAQRKVARLIDGVGARPWGIAVSADGKKVYTANGPSNDVSIIDVASGKVEKRIKVGGLPWGVAAAPTSAETTSTGDRSHPPRSAP